MGVTSQNSIEQKMNINNLIDTQLNVWDLARNNYEALKTVKTKEFQFEGFIVRVQFNPARIQSSAAKVDTKSIQERKCFLCPQNLPEVQQGIEYKYGYQILVNPFPIFPKHLTIPSFDHTDQLILGRYGHMLELAKDLSDYTIFYNGPKCGASAPDHIHFQGGVKGFLPIEKEVIENLNRKLISQEEGLEVYAMNSYLRNCILLVAKDKTLAEKYFDRLYHLLEIPNGEQEPMMNILTWYEEGTWYSCIIPRKKHRPDCFFAEGDANILISPASVDMGGVFITPLEKDFEKITAVDIENILKEVCLDNEAMSKLVDLLV